jgi:hypothetical protein
MIRPTSRHLPLPPGYRESSDRSKFLSGLAPPGGRPAFEEHAQNGARRETVPASFSGARRTLCAFEEHAQNGARREAVPDPVGGARREGVYKWLLPGRNWRSQRWFIRCVFAKSCRFSEAGRLARLVRCGHRRLHSRNGRIQQPFADRSELCRDDRHRQRRDLQSLELCVSAGDDGR